MLTLNDYCQAEFGEKLYKLCLSTGCTCPNRDGTLDTRGCIFCSAGGSGEFAGNAALSVSEQIEQEKRRVAGKFRGGRYIAYFQSYTNTYGAVARLEPLFRVSAEREDIAVLDIATRPDCLGPEILEMLSRLQQIKPVWVELGLQTVKEDSVRYIRRGYPTAVYDAAVAALTAEGIHVITHVILGLPGESPEDMEESVRHAVAAGSGGIKLQLLHVLRGTDLAEDYLAGKFALPTREEYLALLDRCLAQLGKDTVIHRVTGDGPRALLLAPLWSTDKKQLLNQIRPIMEKYL